MIEAKMSNVFGQGGDSVMIARSDISELTWNEKPLAELSREELIELVGVLHDLVWRSAENFEVILRKQWEPRGTA